MRLLHPALLLRSGLLGLTFAIAIPGLRAQDVVCSEVRIEIVQELTFERQAFEARMKINNGLAAGFSVTDISVDVTFEDADRAAVHASRNPDADPDYYKFFIRLQDGMPFEWATDGDVVGAEVPGGGDLTIKWLIIPSSTAGGTLSDGVKYFVGATLRYRVNGREEQVVVDPDYIFVKPLPLLQIDYFLPRYVIGNDPFTTQIEPSEPFSLGVRIVNEGFGWARNLKIDSSQPRIVDNRQGLLVDFRIISSEVNGSPAQPTLLANFGDIGPGKPSLARWNMTGSLMGNFSEFTATFSHADELGGSLTSLIQEPIGTYLLLRDVLVDLPGRDAIRDFLAYENETSSALKVFESEAFDFPVTDLSTAASLTGGGSTYTWRLPPNADFFYARAADPTGGRLDVSGTLRADGKLLPSANVWQDKVYDFDARRYNFWLNIFDASNPAGHPYQISFGSPISPRRPPVFSSLSDRVIPAGVDFFTLVEATDPDADPVQILAQHLPTGASFLPETTVPGRSVYRLSWSAVGPAGVYPITFQARDGVYETEGDITLTVASGSAYELWKLEHGITSDFEDRSYDGLPAAVKFALGLDPDTFNPQAVAIRVDEFVEGTATVDRTVLEYVRKQGDLGFTLVAESSPVADPASPLWTNITRHEISPDQSGVAAGYVRMRAVDSVALTSAVDRRFVRLRPVF